MKLENLSDRSDAIRVGDLTYVSGQAPPYPAEPMVEARARHVPGARIVIDVIAAWARPQAAC